MKLREPTIEAIKEGARTGHVGDGKILSWISRNAFAFAPERSAKSPSGNLHVRMEK